MPIDPSIPLGVQPFVPPDFQAARQRQMTLQALARQNRQGAQSEQDDRRERDKARRLEQALHGATTPAQIVEAYRSVDPYKALEIEASFTKQKREQAKADADLKNTTTTTSKNEAEIHKAHRARLTEDLGVFLTDPEAASAYPSWRAAEIADDPDAGQHLPEQFDPERLAAIQAALTETPATKRQLAEQKWRETVQFPAEERHRRTMENKPTNLFFLNTDQGYIPVNPKTGQPSGGPVTLGGGTGPLKPQRQPSPDVMKMQANAQSGLQSLDDIENLYDAGFKGLTAIQRNLPLGMLDEHAQSYKTASREVADVITRLRTGAALNAQEMSLYQKWIPGASDHPSVARQKIRNLRMLFTKLAGAQQVGSRPSASSVPPVPSDGVTVTDPLGGVHTFLTPQDAAAFKKEAGIR